MKPKLITVILALTAQFSMPLHAGLLELHVVADARTNQTKEYSMLQRDGRSEAVLLDAPILLDQTVLKSAILELEPDGTPRMVLTFTEAGRTLFGEITTRYAGRRLGVVLDDQLQTAPVFPKPILGGSLNVILNLSEIEAAELVKKLNKSINR